MARTCQRSDCRVFWATVATAIACIAAMGCDPPPRPQFNTADSRPRDSTVRPAPRPTDSRAGITPLSRNELLFTLSFPIELWDTYHLGADQRQIGYSHLQADNVGGSDTAKYTVRERILYLGGDDVYEQLLTQTSTETLSGSVRAFTAERIANGARATAAGKLEKSNLVVTMESGDETLKQSLPWKEEYGGILALHQQLRESPLKRGEKRKLEMLAPLFYQLGTLELTAIGQAAVPLRDGETKILQEIESIATIPGNPAGEMFLWTDERGEILKQFVPNQNLTIYRASSADAAWVESPVPGLVAQATVPQSNEPTLEAARPLIATGFVMRPRAGEDITASLPTLPWQQLQVNPNDGSVQIARQAVTIDAASTGNSSPETDSPAGVEPGALSAPEDADRNANTLIQSDDDLIKDLVRREANENPLELVLDLAKLTRERLRNADNPDRFATALAAAVSEAGDSGEHALLLAACCRAKGIPARVAAGLAYDGGTGEGSQTAATPSLRFHMWTLVYANERWWPVDATREASLGSPDRLTVAISNLASTTDFALFRQVLEFTRRADITVKAFKYGEAASAGAP